MSDYTTVPGGFIDSLDVIPEHGPKIVTTLNTRTYSDMDAAGIVDRSVGDLLPLNAGAKFAPPTGTIGMRGTDEAGKENAAPTPRITDAQRATWAPRVGNVALRYAPEVFALDIDDGYKDKTGMATIAAAEATAGALPPTWSICPRGSLHHGGHLLYRWSPDAHLTGDFFKKLKSPGANIDLLHCALRYSVAPGSTVPVDPDDLTQGYREYVWYTPDGTPSEVGPTLDDIPVIPDDWYYEILRDEDTADYGVGGGRASSADAEDFAAQMIADDRPMCRRTRRKLDEAVEMFEAAGSGQHDEALLAGTMSVANVCALGHPGFAEASEVIRQGSADHYGSDAKFDSKMSRALERVTAEHDGEYKPLTGAKHGCEDFDDDDNFVPDLSAFGIDPTPDPVPPAPATETVTVTVMGMDDDGTITRTALPVPVPPSAPASMPAPRTTPTDVQVRERKEEIAKHTAALAAMKEKEARTDPDAMPFPIPGYTSMSDTETPFSLSVHPAADPGYMDKAIKVIRRGLKVNEDEKPKKSNGNYAFIFANDPDLRHLAKNTAGGLLVWAEYVPSWRNSDDQDDMYPDVTEADYHEIAARMCEYYGDGDNAVSDKSVDRAMSRYANHRTRQFNPAKSYLMSLPKWDGETQYLDNLISTIRKTPYVQEVFRRIGLHMVKAVLDGDERGDPAMHNDCTPVLIGEAGTHKTSWARSIWAGAPGVIPYVMVTEVPVGEAGKDIRIRRHGSPIEIKDEFDMMVNRLGDQRAMKSDMSATADYDRAPYEHRSTRRVRHFFSIGTSNEKELISDEGMERRLWPLEVIDEIPPEEMTPEYHALWLAEARDRYLAGERPMDDKAFADLARDERSEFLDDPVGDLISAFLSNPISRVTGGPLPKPDMVRICPKLLEKHCEGFRELAMSRRTVNSKFDTYMNRRGGYTPLKGKQRVTALNNTTQTHVWEIDNQTKAAGATVTKLRNGYHGVPTDAPCGIAPTPDVITRGPSTGLNTVSYDGPTGSSAPGGQTLSSPVPPTTPDPAA